MNRSRVTRLIVIECEGDEGEKGDEDDEGDKVDKRNKVMRVMTVRKVYDLVCRDHGKEHMRWAASCSIPATTRAGTDSIRPRNCKALRS